MRRAIIIIGLLAAIIFGTGWRGGNTADYNADTICAVKYKIHPPRTDVGCEGCKPFVQMLPCVPVVLEGDTVCLPVLNLDSLADTVYIATENETVYSVVYDTIIVISQGGAFFTTVNRWFCDSNLIAIDTSTSPWDSLYCVFCDSVQSVAWFAPSDDPYTPIRRIALWQWLMPNFQDSCELVYFNDHYVSYHYDTTTFIETLYIDSSAVIDTAGTQIYVVDSLTGLTYIVSNGDTIYLHTTGSGAGGVWWRYCSDSINTFTPSDSFDLFTCIDNTWLVYYGSRRMSSATNYDTVINYILSLREVPYHYKIACQGLYAAHTLTGREIEDSVRAIFGLDTLIIANGGDTITAPEALYMDFDTTKTDSYGVWLRGCADTCSIWNVENCRLGGEETQPTEYDFEQLVYKSIDFHTIYSDSVIIALNYQQQPSNHTP